MRPFNPEAKNGNLADLHDETHVYYIATQKPLIIDQLKIEMCRLKGDLSPLI